MSPGTYILLAAVGGLAGMALAQAGLHYVPRWHRARWVERAELNRALGRVEAQAAELVRVKVELHRLETLFRETAEAVQRMPQEDLDLAQIEHEVRTRYPGMNAAQRRQAAREIAAKASGLMAGRSRRAEVAE